MRVIHRELPVGRIACSATLEGAGVNHRRVLSNARGLARVRRPYGDEAYRRLSVSSIDAERR
ncbi:MAG: hypothetical protein AVDCRST_MAG17-1288 [uncultured Solirubrobacterales bacterium]|uniref:Uncharacterized protein n=1 Tax=uncultured Solirubrobacterales bacterium TaxID=768556 RepID=A0A6J4SP79_9ACTN|nr:MAG: hypothetical protein AVDCRST_MAG17-1288 [uncultured Solirubrobacterales bacterium]